MSETNRLRRAFACTASAASFAAKPGISQAQPRTSEHDCCCFVRAKETPPVNGVATPKLRQRRRWAEAGAARRRGCIKLSELATVVTNGQVAAIRES